MIFPKPCLTCQQLFTARSDYCDTCRAERDRKREANPSRRQKKVNLYNYKYRQTAKALREVATHCHICKEPFTDRTEITADHLIPSDPNSPLAPAHARCNSSRGNKPL